MCDTGDVLNALHHSNLKEIEMGRLAENKASVHHAALRLAP
jgi:hypothetical protein